jgi:hypothetical protein
VGARSATNMLGAMKTSFRIVGLPLANFAPLFSLNETALAEKNAHRAVADKKPGFPCRVSLEDAEPGESLILLPFAHHSTDSPYRASGPIFVRENAKEAALSPNEIPEAVRSRMLSVRAYDETGMMLDAEVTEGTNLETQIEQFFVNPRISYLHLHNAGAGCYSCRVERV